MSKIFVAVLALALAALTNSAGAATWEHFNADPAYPSHEAAIADASRVMRQARYPEPVIRLLTEAMKKPGVRTHVTNDMKLDFMRSGKSALWRNVEVKFKKPPREASMEYSAPSEEWTADWNGTTWTVGIPDVCNNTYGKRGPRTHDVSTPTVSQPPAQVPVPQVPAPVPQPAAPVASQYGLQVNYMDDRPDGYWTGVYEAAKAKRAENIARPDINKQWKSPYFEVFTSAPSGSMLTERKNRPLDSRFLIRLLKKAPVLNIQSGDSAAERVRKYGEFLRQYQYPPEENVLSAKSVSTGRRGWVIVPVDMPLAQFEAVVVQPQSFGEVLEPLIVLYRRDFERLSNPVHIWEVKAR